MVGKTRLITSALALTGAAGAGAVVARELSHHHARTPVRTVTGQTPVGAVRRPRLSDPSVPSVPRIEIGGGATGLLMPGRGRALNLTLRNPRSDTVTVMQISTAIDAVHAPQATAELPCSSVDFKVRQLHLDGRLSLPGRSTRSLSELGIPRSRWPRLVMLNLPVDQDGCRHAQVMLRYWAPISR